MSALLLTIGAYCELFILLASFVLPFVVWKIKSLKVKRILTVLFGVAIILGVIAAILAEQLKSYHEGDWLGFALYYIFALPIEVFSLISCVITAFWKRNGLFVLLFAPVIFVAFYLSLIIF